MSVKASKIDIERAAYHASLAATHCLQAMMSLDQQTKQAKDLYSLALSLTGESARLSRLAFDNS